MVRRVAMAATIARCDARFDRAGDCDRGGALYPKLENFKPGGRGRLAIPGCHSPRVRVNRLVLESEVFLGQDRRLARSKLDY